MESLVKRFKNPLKSRPKVCQSREAAHRSYKQNLSAKLRSRKLYDNALTKFEDYIVMNNQTYVKTLQTLYFLRAW